MRLGGRGRTATPSAGTTWREKTGGLSRCIRRGGVGCSGSSGEPKRGPALCAAGRAHRPQRGVVVAAQTVLAEMLGVTDRTIRTLTKALEEQGAVVRIRVGAGTYAYALDPDEVWKAWDVQKDHAVFRTKTLVSKRGDNSVVKRRLQVMIAEMNGSQSCPLRRFDLETGEAFRGGRAS